MILHIHPYIHYIYIKKQYRKSYIMLSVEELNDRLIDLAFAEDIGDGDHTTL